MSSDLFTEAQLITARFKREVADKLKEHHYVYDNSSDEPSPAEGYLWCRVSIVWGERRQADFGATAKRRRRVGFLVVQIFARHGDGDGPSLKLAAAIESAFDSATENSVQFRTAETTVPGRRENLWQTNVSAPFYADAVEGSPL